MTSISAATSHAVGEAGRWHLGPSPCAATDVIDPHRMQERIAQRAGLRRWLDIVGALLLLIPGGPLVLLAALAVRAEDRGPWLYRQERIQKPAGLDLEDGRVALALQPQRLANERRK